MIDRSVDLITPLLTGLTYTAMIHDNFKIEGNIV